jgi:hypothetical protein
MILEPPQSLLQHRSSTPWVARCLGLSLLALLLGAGCEDASLGRQCTIASADADPSVATFGSQALECSTRLCLQVAQATGASTTPRPQCTAECGSDDDCSSGENCNGGFTCVVPQTTGPFCCRKFCVCRDFLFVPPGGATVPDACNPASNPPPTCQNL